MQQSTFMRMPLLAKFLTVFCGLTLSGAVLAGDTAQVSLKTTMGEIVVELNGEKAPKTVANFLQYVKSGHYKGTIFHRVIDGFMVQGGGFDKNMAQKTAGKPIQNEASNGLQNLPYSIAMARTGDPHSATAQFFINVNHNAALDYPGRDGFGYAVFGRVIKGQDVVDKIRAVEVADSGRHANVPVKPVVIESATLLKTPIAVESAPAPAAETVK